jgi:hypothetical protein
MDAGNPLPAHDPKLDFQQEAAACFMSAELPWQEALRAQQESEKEAVLF